MKFYPDEEENPEYWWDVELDDVRYEVYSIEKDEGDPEKCDFANMALN
jgi:hypothetical protein